VSLAEELGSRGHDAKPVEGKRSQFDVVADGTLVFSKEREHRYPEVDDIVAALG
jgi:hypothetical protein